MKKVLPLLIKSLVRPFYKQNAGQFVFIFILFFGAVGELEGKVKYTGPLYQFHYQYALILGMLTNPVLLGLVLLLWLVYAEKCATYVLSTIRRPDHLFIYQLNSLDPARLFALLLLIQGLLYLPVVLYSLAVISVAVYKKWYMMAIFIPAYILLVCLLTSLRYRYQLRNPGRQALMIIPLLVRQLSFLSGRVAYWQLLFRYAMEEQKWFLAGIKLFSCGVLYLGIRTVTPDDYDIRMPFLFYSIGLFGHGVLIYKIRSWEETTLLFYRGLPVSRLGRLLQYIKLYLFLLIPEMIVLVCLLPLHLHYTDALLILSTGFGTLLLLNNLLFVGPLTMKDYLKMALCFFLVVYFCLLSGILLWLCVLFLAAAIFIFYSCYYRYESDLS